MSATFVQAMPADEIAKMTNAMPLRRGGTPDEVAASIAFLLSDDCHLGHRTGLVCKWWLDVAE